MKSRAKSMFSETKRYFICVLRGGADEFGGRHHKASRGAGLQAFEQCYAQGGPQKLGVILGVYWVEQNEGLRLGCQRYLDAYESQSAKMA